MEQEGSTRPLSTEELLRDHTKGLEAGLQELAVTGRAFTVLRRSEAMDRLLYFTRIYARFTPADKVILSAYMSIRVENNFKRYCDAYLPLLSCRAFCYFVIRYDRCLA